MAEVVGAEVVNKKANESIGCGIKSLVFWRYLHVVAGVVSTEVITKKPVGILVVI